MVAKSLITSLRLPLALLMLLVFLTPASAAAITCPQGQVESDGKCVTVEVPDNNPTGSDINPCDPAVPGCSASGPTKCDRNCIIDKYLNPIINFLAVSVGLIVTIVIIVGGIQYASSSDDPQKVAKAKARIGNAVLGLVAFLFVYAFLQWIIPGGFL